MEYKRKELAKGIVLLVQDNKEYLKDAPEGFSEVVKYLTEANENNKNQAADAAVEEFKANPKTPTVKVRVPFGTGKLDNLELVFQRERGFPDTKNPGKRIVSPFMGQKPKSRVLGTDTQMAEVKARFKKGMAKL